ncbi:MAG: hypothetical protein HC897_09195 [Thermoanaerobaculia bacterium]|nr:hypothetical protein [Thermoanaerobaculia bacterium]
MAMKPRRYKPYPAYKDSGVEWLGEIPVEWEVKPLKVVSSLQTGLTLGKSYEGRSLITRPYLRVANVQDGYLDLVNIAEVELPAQDAARYELRQGDVLMTEGGDFDKLGRGYVWEAQVENCLHQNHIFAVRPLAEDLHPRFLAMVLSSGYGRAYFTATAKQSTNLASTNSTKLRNFSMPLPHLIAQHAIAAFLDRETAKIDALLAKKERLIELLQEKRAALTENAARGEHSSPETKLGYYVDLLPGYAFPSDEFSCDSADIRLLRGVNISTDGIRWDDTVLWPMTAAARFEAYKLREGDLVFGMDRPWISTGIRVAEVTAADLPALVLQRVARLRAKQGLLQRYLKLVLSSPQFLAYFEPILTGISVPHVSPEQILSFRLRLPTLAAQEAICQRAQVDSVKLDALISKAREAIDRLKELRTALISAAVTGKIDVRNLEA